MLEDSSGLLTNCVDGGKHSFQRKKPRKFDVSERKVSKPNVEGIGVKRKWNADEEEDKTKQIKRDKVVSKEADDAKPVVSSLFHKNPLIPHIEERHVKQIVERIFSTSTLEDLPIHSYIISNVRQCFGVERLTAVQEKTIPRILNGEDVLVKSQTGSGKTLAYVIPIIDKLQSLDPQINRSSGLFVTVVLPTRELALQTYECFQKLLRSFTRIVPACFMGGQRRKSEKAILRRGINVLVSTPQRLIDHLKNSKQFSLAQLKYLVLDEADRLMDMGYEKDVAAIIEEIGKARETQGLTEPIVTVLLSATLTQGVQKLAGLTMRNPVTVDISSESDEWGASLRLVTPSNLQHHFVVVPAKLRLVCLMAFILWKCRCDQHKMLVFLPTQDTVDYLTVLASYVNGRSRRSDDETPRDIRISQLHGNMSQQMRNEVFKKMRAADCGVLFCTDVCARGLDLPKVDWIVQFSAPATAAEYVHRVGRTARIGTRGDSLLFLLPSEVQYLALLEQNRIKLRQLTLEEVLEALPRVNRMENQSARPSKTMSVEEAATSLQLECERHVESDAVTHAMATKAFLSLTRSYATYPTPVRHIFNIKELHLGHVAKGLALRDTPTQLGLQRTSSSHQHHQRTPSTKGRKKKEVDDWKARLMDEYRS